MPSAARVGDQTNHPGQIAGPGVATVLIGGQPAAVAGDQHICALPPNAGPHPATPLMRGSSSVRIGRRPAMRQGDQAGCGAVIVAGASNVKIGG